MQTLQRTLEDHDITHLRILAELWDIELPAGGTRAVLPVLVRAMLAPGAAEELAASLPPRTAEALGYLLSRQGRAPLADLNRSFGPLRVMGRARRDRDKPWLDREAALDGLFYRGLLARAFADSPTGPLEFGFVPDDLLERLPRPSPPPASLGKPAPAPSSVRFTGTQSVDDATTLLASLRRRPSSAADLTPARRAELAPFLRRPEALELLAVLLLEQGVLQPARLRPEPQSARAFLELSPPAAAELLRRAWAQSRAWNDLAHVPGLSLAPRGRTWPNDPVLTRTSVLSLLPGVPTETWWDLEAFVADVRHEQPAFQRPGGDFDSWYLLVNRDGLSLTGFDHWETVDGGMLRFMIEGPLFWLGAVELGCEAGRLVAFRKTPAYNDLMAPAERIDAAVPPESGLLARIEADGLIYAPAGMAAAQRYQVARFVSWVGLDQDTYIYRLTPSALTAARAQGLSPAQVRVILEHASGASLPEGLAMAIRRWEKRGAEARVEATFLLETSEPRMLKELQTQRSTARYLGKMIGPTAVRVRQADVQPLLSAAARLGILIEPPGSP
ncbi:MAG TPA: helicase-associated domain-containing protein [Anaerolineales bacterium]|nr:helicase-associated domain-containing protein [Anaerolineales bacterium]